jgi:hypothetical protein
MFRKLAPIAFVALAMTTASAAQAQVALTNGVSFSSAGPTGAYNMLDLGSTAGSGYVTRMPMSLSYGGVDVTLSFTSAAGLKAAGENYNPTPGQNFIYATTPATIQFSSAQTFFGAMWGSPDVGNMLQFYSGSELLASFSGAQYQNATGLNSHSVTQHASFAFSEVGYDRVVLSSSSGGFEVGGITFSDQPVDVAPIPLNAASLGGLLSFLMMLAMRGKGGTQVMVRMAFASMMPRRRVVA